MASSQATIAESDSGSVAFSGSAGGSVTLSQLMVTVSAYVRYTGSVVAFTAAGSSDSTASDPQFSPQAGNNMFSPHYILILALHAYLIAS